MTTRGTRRCAQSVAQAQRVVLRAELGHTVLGDHVRRGDTQAAGQCIVQVRARQLASAPFVAAGFEEAAPLWQFDSPCVVVAGIEKLHEGERRPEEGHGLVCGAAFFEVAARSGPVETTIPHTGVARFRTEAFPDALQHVGERRAWCFVKLRNQAQHSNARAVGHDVVFETALQRSVVQCQRVEMRHSASCRRRSAGFERGALVTRFERGNACLPPRVDGQRRHAACFGHRAGSVAQGIRPVAIHRNAFVLVGEEIESQSLESRVELDQTRAVNAVAGGAIGRMTFEARGCRAHESEESFLELP